MAEESKEFKHILRVANTDLDGEKPVVHALKKIKGVSFMFANLVCNVSGVDKTKKVGYLSDSETQKIEDVIVNPAKFNVPVWMLNRRNDYESGVDKHLLGADLNFQNDNDIKRLKMIKAYKGMRHAAGLPVRGQKTKSNFRRNKGKGLGVKRKKGKGGRV
jgi:small subunit ribosomal protein S13